MMVANVPAVWMGEVFADRINRRATRVLATALFVVLGTPILIAGIGST